MLPNLFPYIRQSKKFSIDPKTVWNSSGNIDYKRYHNYILSEKERERKQLEMLMGYLDKVLQEAGLSAEMANRARFQQNQILGEMDKIKGELDRITGEQHQVQVVPRPQQTNLRHI